MPEQNSLEQLHFPSKGSPVLFRTTHFSGDLKTIAFLEDDEQSAAKLVQFLREQFY
jgi:hypothetical protein